MTLIQQDVIQLLDTQLTELITGIKKHHELLKEISVDLKNSTASLKKNDVEEVLSTHMMKVTDRIYERLERIKNSFDMMLDMIMSAENVKAVKSDKSIRKVLLLEMCNMDNLEEKFNVILKMLDKLEDQKGEVLNVVKD